MNWGLLNVCDHAWRGDTDLPWHLQEEQDWVKGSVPLEPTLKKKMCTACHRPWPEHTIAKIGSLLEWVCPPMK